MKKAQKSRCRILLVEDHEPTRRELARLLTKRSFDVTGAGTVEETLAVAAREGFDLVISDIGLPDGDGYALMSRLRSVYGLPGIALTAFGMKEDIELSRIAGFSAHLTKPVKLMELDRTLAPFKAQVHAS